MVMRITSQLVLGYLFAIAAVGGFWLLSQWYSGTLIEDRDEIVEEWAEMDAIVGGIATLHHAHSDPEARSRLGAQAERLGELARSSADGDEEHDVREAKIFAELAAILDEATRVESTALPALSDRAQELAFSLWSEDLGRVPARLESVQPKRRRARAIRVALSAVLLILPLLYIVIVQWRVVRPMARLHRRIADIGGVAPLPEKGEAAIARLDRAVDVMGSAVEKQRRDLEAQVEDRTVQLRHANRLSGIGRIGAAVAHELNTPLGSLDLCLEGIGEALEEGGEESRATVDRYIATARQQVLTCTATTRKLLSYSHLEPREETAAPVSDLVREAGELVRSHAQRLGVSINTDVAPDTPEVRGDVAQLRQVLVNLLLNAADASPQHESVSVSACRDGNRVRIAVRDHGVGIPADLAEEIFNPFFTTKRVGEGTGLGLSISREIIEAHGGSIALEESEDGGACFVVRLPAADEVVA